MADISKIKIPNNNLPYNIKDSMARQTIDQFGDIVTHDVDEFATSAQGSKADSAYQKPSSGIPKSDLASSVQTSLQKADSAIQSHQSLSNYYTKSETDSFVATINSTIDSKTSAEASARTTADTNLDNAKQNKLNTSPGYSATANIVLVSIAGDIQWKPFNNILAGSTTPISSEGNDGDIYLQIE